jgi:hypothetical protein
MSDVILGADAQPTHRGRAAELRALGDEYSHSSLDPASGKGQYCSAGRVQPLEVIDRQEHGCIGSERLENCQERAGHRALLEFESLVVAVQQHCVDRCPLRVRQPDEDGRLDLAQQVCHRRVVHRRFRSTYARGQDQRPVITRLFRRGRPQGRLADAGLTLDGEARGARADRCQEIGDGAQFPRTAYHLRRQGHIRRSTICINPQPDLDAH